MKLTNKGVYLCGGKPVVDAVNMPEPDKAREGTLAYKIMRAHDTGEDQKKLHIRFDALVSHDITYVGIIQTARASGMTEFPIPYAMTNCHNSLCAVGGTINEDDHVFGLSAAKKYGGIFVPPNLSVIHMYAREALATCGNMILGSDSHTRYGALGTMGFGEGGAELVKQLLCNTYDVDAPEVVLVHVTGAPKKGVGPHDVALALVKAVFKNGFVKNKVLEFVGEGIKNLTIDFRNGIDVMTTETSCLSSIWETDEVVDEYYKCHHREYAYEPMHPDENAYYDAMIELDLGEIECMIALPFHPSNAYTIHEFQANAKQILAELETTAKETYPTCDIHLQDKVTDKGVLADQGVIAGCAGGLYENLVEAASILKNNSIGNEYFGLSVYPGSQPVGLALAKNGTTAELMDAGAVVKPAFCGPCFGAGDVPANNGLSIRHTTRNFPNREGSKPKDGQISFVALMDARSIAATAKNGGIITAATDIEYEVEDKPYVYDPTCYEKRVYQGFAKENPNEALRLGPNITDWPVMPALSENLLLKLTAVINDEVTTTDELIPSGETSSYRSNPLRLSEFTLSRRVPSYVGDAKKIMAMDKLRLEGNCPKAELDIIEQNGGKPDNTIIASVLFAKRPGDGSAREQAASCQKVLGSFANIAYEYCTKRYRSNCINWGVIPFTIDSNVEFPYDNGDYVFVPAIKSALETGKEQVEAMVIAKDGSHPIRLNIKNLSEIDRQILLDGCLMNYYAREKKND
ncbi:MAG: hydratase [Eubacteriales bacterium]|nr:hydratase [Eubacteriales bacterium]